MKKIIWGLALVVVVALLSASCGASGASKTCPAYSLDQPTEQTDGQNS